MMRACVGACFFIRCTAHHATASSSRRKRACSGHHLTIFFVRRIHEQLRRRARRHWSVFTHRYSCLNANREGSAARSPPDCGLRFRTQTATEIIHGRAARLKRVRAQRRGTPPAHAERPPTRQVPAGAMQAEIGLAKNLKGKRVCQGVPQLEAPAAPSGTDCGWTLAAARRQA